MNLPYSIRMYWTHFSQPTLHLQQNIFEEALAEVGSSHLYAYFGTFCVEIGKFVDPQGIFEKCLKIDQLLLLKENVVDFEILSNV